MKSTLRAYDDIAYTSHASWSWSTRPAPRVVDPEAIWWIDEPANLELFPAVA